VNRHLLIDLIAPAGIEVLANHFEHMSCFVKLKPIVPSTTPLDCEVCAGLFYIEFIVGELGNLTAIPN